ncbi:MAG: hypothetical protein ACT4PT_03920 [Methanobacteriota archaeon]
MPVRKIEISSIEAKRFARGAEKQMQVRIDHNSTVTVVQESNPQLASIEFRYTASYGAMGLIKLEGNIAFECDAYALSAQWHASNQMPAEVASEIHNAVMRVCIPEAVSLAKDLNLPPPIPLPQVGPQGPIPPPKPAAGTSDAGAGPGPEIA